MIYRIFIDMVFILRTFQTLEIIIIQINLKKNLISDIYLKISFSFKDSFQSFKIRFKCSWNKFLNPYSRRAPIWFKCPKKSVLNDHPDQECCIEIDPIVFFQIPKYFVDEGFCPSLDQEKTSSHPRTLTDDKLSDKLSSNVSTVPDNTRRQKVVQFFFYIIRL